MATTRALEDPEIFAMFEKLGGRYAVRDRTMLIVAIHMALRATDPERTRARGMREFLDEKKYRPGFEPVKRPEGWWRPLSRAIRPSVCRARASLGLAFSARRASASIALRRLPAVFSGEIAWIFGTAREISTSECPVMRRSGSNCRP